MDRLWLLGGVVVVLVAAIIGWLDAGAEARLESALVLADVATPGCDEAGKVHLVLGNAADRPMRNATGVLSIARTATEQPVPIGNFEVMGPIAPGHKIDACVAVDEARIAGGDRKALVWLARTTAVEFDEAGR